MSWSHEIIRALLLVLGSFEISTNATYLIRRNGFILARKQHGELPKNTSDNQIKIKVVCMLFFGITFFIIALLSYILHTYLQPVIFVATALFAVYGIVEAIHYRYWKTVGFGMVTIILFSIQALI
jgi:hypothetical protein